MKRALPWACGVAAILLITGGLIWWMRSQRPVPLVPNNLAAMSEKEQVAWLIERILERSERPDVLRESLYSWFPRLRRKYDIHDHSFESLTWACATFDMEEQLKRLQSWARTPQDRDNLLVAESRIWAKHHEWHKALRAARHISDPEKKNLAYRLLAQDEAGVGQRAAAHRTLQEVLKMTPPGDRHLEPIAHIAANLRFPDLAEQAAARLSKHFMRNFVLSRIAATYATLGQESEAQRVTRLITDPIERGISYAEIAHALMRQGRWMEAIALIEKTGNPVAYARGACYLAQHGRTAQARLLWNKATRSANRLQEPLRSRALSQIAIEYARAGNPDAALRVYEQVARLTRAAKVGSALCIIVDAYAAKGRRHDAVEVWNRYLPQEALSPFMMGTIIGRLYQSGYPDEARLLQKTLQASLRTRASLEDYPWEILIHALVQSGALPLARELVTWYEREAASITSRSNRSVVDRYLVKMHAYIGDIPGAVRYTARETDYETQASQLISIIEVLTSLKNP